MAQSHRAKIDGFALHLASLQGFSLARSCDPQWLSGDWFAPPDASPINTINFCVDTLTIAKVRYGLPARGYRAIVVVDDDVPAG